MIVAEHTDFVLGRDLVLFLKKGMPKEEAGTLDFR
jgi:hypothetical protein